MQLKINLRCLFASLYLIISANRCNFRSFFLSSWPLAKEYFRLEFYFWRKILNCKNSFLKEVKHLNLSSNLNVHTIGYSKIEVFYLKFELQNLKFQPFYLKFGGRSWNLNFKAWNFTLFTWKLELEGEIWSSKHEISTFLLEIWGSKHEISAFLLDIWSSKYEISTFLLENWGEEVELYYYQVKKKPSTTFKS